MAHKLQEPLEMKNKKRCPSCPATKHMSKRMVHTRWKWSGTRSPKPNMRNGKRNMLIMTSTCSTFCLRYKRKSIIGNIVRKKCKKTSVMSAKKPLSAKKTTKASPILTENSKKSTKKSRDKPSTENEQILYKLRGHKMHQK